MLAAIRLCMPYMEKRDLQHVSLVSKQLNEDARQEMRHRTRMLAQLAFRCVRENENTFVVAGSMALWLRQGSPTSWFPNDVDLFWYGGPKFADPCECRAIFKTKERSHCISFMHKRRPLVRTIETKLGSVQFILTSLFKTKQDVLETFDLTCCRIGATDMTTFVTVDPHFDPNSFKWMCPSQKTVLQFGKGEKEDLIALNNLQRIRTLRRAKKYEQRGLENTGFEEGTIELLAFSIMYRRPSLFVYQNNLVPRSTSDRRYLKYCTCTHECCVYCKESLHLRSAYAYNEDKVSAECII